MLALRPWVSSWKRRAHSAFMPVPMRAGAIASSGACCTSIGFPTIRPTAAATSRGVYSRGPASSMTRLPLPPSASRRAAAVPTSRAATMGIPLVPDKECWKDALLDGVERPTPVFHEVPRTDERHGGFGSTEYSLCVAEAEHRTGSIRLLSADGREQDDMWDACGLDCRSDGVCAAVVVHARMARTEVRRKEDIDAFRAAEGTLERCPFVDIGDSDIRTRFAPRLPLGGVVQGDADLLLLPEQCLGDDLACIARSTKHDEHSEPPPRCATPSRDEQPAPSAVMFPMNVVPAACESHRRHDICISTKSA